MHPVIIIVIIIIITNVALCSREWRLHSVRAAAAESNLWEDSGRYESHHHTCRFEISVSFCCCQTFRQIAQKIVPSAAFHPIHAGTRLFI